MRLDLLDPEDEDERMFLLEAAHPQFWKALDTDTEVVILGEPMSPRLHIAMHSIAAAQLLADEPPQTWLTVQRLAGLGYGWHDVMHMIAGVIAADVYRITQGQEGFDQAEYARRLDELPGDWPRKGD